MIHFLRVSFLIRKGVPIPDYCVRMMRPILMKEGYPTKPALPWL